MKAETDREIENEAQHNFQPLVLIFLIGALSFAVALSYNNFASQIIDKYSFAGDGVFISFVNMAGVTITAIALLYFVWKINPKIVTRAVL